MKRLTLLIIIISVTALTACHPLPQYQAKVERIDSAYLRIRENAGMSSYQKNQAFLTVLKNEFPEYGDKLSSIEADYERVFEIRGRGQDATAELDNANVRLADFLAFTKQEAYKAKLMELETNRQSEKNIENMRPLICAKNLPIASERTNCD